MQQKTKPAMKENVKRYHLSQGDIIKGQRWVNFGHQY